MKIQIKSFVQNGNLKQNRTLIKNAIERLQRLILKNNTVYSRFMCPVSI